MNFWLRRKMAAIQPLDPRLSLETSVSRTAGPIGAKGGRVFAKNALIKLRHLRRKNRRTSAAKSLMPTIDKEVAPANSSARPQRSLGMMVASSLVSACCGVVLTFYIPRLLSLDDFGAWRMFLLYAGYAGLLHLGLVDGALLLWSGDKPTATHTLPLLYRALRFVAVEHLCLICLAGVAFLWSGRPEIHLLLMAVAVYALLFNLIGVLQVYLQAGFRFMPVALGMSAPGVLFVISAGVFSLTHVSVERLLAGYLAGWAIGVVALFWTARGEPSNHLPAADSQSPSSWQFGMRCIATGWPIVLANTGFGLMQSADRVTINLTRPLHDFAIYSFSQSTIYVPITVLAAVSRVAFSWFARAHADDRAAIYRSSTRMLSLVWMLLLASYFVVEAVVRDFLPRYVPGLPAGRILLISVLFLSLIQIVQGNTFSLEGRQRQFFLGSIAATVLAFATAWYGSERIGTLTAVAWSQVVTAGLWWLGNEWVLRRHRMLGGRDMLVVLTTFSIAASALYLGSLGKMSWVLRPEIYYGCITVPAILLYRPELHNLWVRARP